MGWLLNIYYDEQSLLITIFKILSFGTTGDSTDEYSTTALHLGLWKLEFGISISWRKNGKKESK